MRTPEPTPLPVRAFPAPCDSERVRPFVTPISRPHYDGLERGLLLLQQCGACARCRLTFGPRCPWCGHRDHEWVPASGQARVHSWTRYHRAYLDEFEHLRPYVVVAARLEEGPILFGRLDGTQHAPAIGAPLRGVIERWRDGFCGLAFTLAGELE